MFTEPIQIREPTTADALQIRRVQARSWCVTYPNQQYGITAEWVKAHTDSWFTPDALAHAVEFVGKVLAAPNRFYRVAEVDAAIVGFVHAIRHSAGFSEISAIYVDPPVIGTGVGAALMDVAMDWIGKDAARLDVAPYNERAIRFYRRYGFREVAHSQRLFYVTTLVDLSASTNAPTDLRLNQNAIPTIDMLREALS